ncbi:jg1622 [Pararge aegeria aegeria]|uniref:Jg1622 protein n=1 Tax=Pararge aegeria aegeria TaxID=348720 RepID=A0A8S4RED0_9NEOP|nr:jg1622 [Pararge aegeria aegeria]
MNLYLLLITFSLVNGDTRNNMLPNRTTIVHLFEWKWRDIADECERFLGPKGFGGVQISPPSENLIINTGDKGRTWYERYQVMSYKLTTRSGNRSELLDMTRRCNRVGVRIYADVVVNHMTGSQTDNKGTGGSTANFDKYDYPGVPYNASHFHHPYCEINNYYDASEVS